MRFFALAASAAALRLTQKSASKGPSADEIWAEVLHHVDADGSGTVEWSELSAWIDQMCAAHDVPAKDCGDAKAYIKGEFDRVDTSGDGSVDKAEFKAEAAKHGVHLSVKSMTAAASKSKAKGPSADEVWAHILEHIDADGSGTVEWSELSAYVDRYCAAESVPA